MLAHSKSAVLSKGRILTACLASPLLCLHSGQAFGQTELTIQAPSNYVSGEGLSPSYFLPPSTVPLVQPPVESLPTAPSNPLIGSGLQPNALQPIVPQPIPSQPILTETVTQAPIPTTIPVPFPASETISPPPSPSTGQSVDLDLRSPSMQPGMQVASGGYTQAASRPLGSPSPWFFGASGLIMNLKDQEDRVFSSSALDPSTRLLGSSDVRMGSTGGYELGVGRYFGCGKYALSASYWGLSPAESVATASSANSGLLATNIPFNVPSNVVPGVSEGLFVGGSSLNDLFNGASEHRLQRQSEFNNVELNLTWFALGGAARQPLAPNCNDGQCWSLSNHPTTSNAPWFHTPSRLRMSLFSGVRWFQFQDQLRYSALDAYYKNDVRNDLWGIQSGATTHVLLTPRWSFWNNLSAGLYNNRSQLETAAGNGTTLATIVSSGSANGGQYNYDASGNGTSFLGETTSGLAWHFARGWTANLGYRVLGASGIASAQSQIPSDFRSPSQASMIRANDFLILHGVTLGASYNF
ncbi:MAG: hypothetical protein LW724_15075 [Planctomycetaceae bacterium]|nr:hypothetical protein [Planctomycetaceae bacterium]